MKMKEKQREEALRRMGNMKLGTEIVEAFKAGDLAMCDKVTIINFGTLPVIELLDGEILTQIREIEEEYNLVVYAVVKSYTEFGTLYDLLYVSQYEEEWGMDEELWKDKIVMSYCINQDIPHFSEFGSIGVDIQKGHLYRTC